MSYSVKCDDCVCLHDRGVSYSMKYRPQYTGSISLSRFHLLFTKVKVRHKLNVPFPNLEYPSLQFVQSIPSSLLLFDRKQYHSPLHNFRPQGKERRKNKLGHLFMIQSVEKMAMYYTKENYIKDGFKDPQMVHLEDIRMC